MKENGCEGVTEPKLFLHLRPSYKMNHNLSQSCLKETNKGIPVVAGLLADGCVGSEKNN